ncbi:MAG: PLP-dependent transferase [Planctomycetales bacterium]|nr:PLP-dependent transferase [Planctomycetales bacterium]
MNNPLRPEPWKDELELSALDGCNDQIGAQHPQSPTLVLSSVWQMANPDAADRVLQGSTDEFVYRRDGHPNASSLASVLARLHGGCFGVLTAQGMSALAALVLSELQPHSQVWLANELYGKSTALFSNQLQKWGISYHSFDPTSPEDLEALTNSQCDMVLVETISNPRLRVADLEKLATATHAAGSKLAVDNTFATHLLCRPLDLGADWVIESLGKIVNGHSDTMLGLLVGNDPDRQQAINQTVSTFGLASSPLDCYLTNRGLMSLAVRMERANQNAAALATALQTMNSALRVDYPGLVTHPQHKTAARILRGGFGWMLTVGTGLARPQVAELFNSLAPEIPFVPSLGDVMTTVSHPSSTSHRGLTAQARDELGIDEGTVRISCGIEPTAWLVDRFSRALQNCL